MRKLYYYVVSLACVFALHACSDNDEPAPPPPSKGAEEVNKIVEVLEEKTEISTFVEVLKTVDVANLEEDKLTVFAVRNTPAGTRAPEEALDSASIKRHIAVGSYQKTELKDGMTLKSINGENLYVSHSADGDVNINGVSIEGEAIKAGNSYVYIIPEMLAEQKEPVEKKYATTISVQALWVDGKPFTPLEGVAVTVYDGAGKKLGEWTTGAEGEVLIEHAADSIAYQLKKEGYTEYHDGYLLDGITTDGGLKYVDFNGDGKWDANDKVDTANPYWYSVGYKGKDVTESKQTCYMMAVKSEIPEMDVAQMKEAWDAAVQEYFEKLLSLESVLFTGSDPEAFTSDETMRFYTNPLWTSAYNALDKAAEYMQQLNDKQEEGATTLLTDIRVDRAIIRCQLYGYYGQLLDGGNLISGDQLTADLQQAINTSSAQAADAMRLLLAKVSADKGEWNAAYGACRQVIDGASYQLTSLYAPAEKEFVWNCGSVKMGGSDAFVGLLLREAYLLAAVGNNKLGNQAESVANIERLKAAFAELGEVSATTNAGVADLANWLLKGNGGQLYPYYRLLKTPIPGAEGFQDKHYYLPIPQTALDACPELEQNPGYN